MSSGPSAAPPCRSQRKLCVSSAHPSRHVPSLCLAGLQRIFGHPRHPRRGEPKRSHPPTGLIHPPPPRPTLPSVFLRPDLWRAWERDLKLRGVGAAAGGGSRDPGLGSCPACSYGATWQRGLSRLPALLRKRVGKRLRIINTWGAFCLRSALQTRPN